MDTNNPKNNKNLLSLGIGLLITSVLTYIISLIIGLLTFNANSTNPIIEILMYLAGGMFVIGLILFLLFRKAK